MKTFLVIAALLTLVISGCSRRMTWQEMHSFDTYDHKAPIMMPPVSLPVRHHIAPPVETRDC